MRTNKRPRRRRRGTARRITAITAIRTDHGGHGRPRPATAGHGGHDRSRRSLPATAEGFGRGHGGRRERRTRERYCRTTHTGERTSERTDRTASSAGDTAPVSASQGRTFRRGVTTPTSRWSRRASVAGVTAPCGVGAADHAESRLARRVTAGTDGHGVHGGSRGVCRRTFRRGVTTPTSRWSRRASVAGVTAPCGVAGRVTARTARHGGHGRSRRARREPWGLSPPGAKSLRHHYLCSELERLVTFWRSNARYLLTSRNGYVPASESPADG